MATQQTAVTQYINANGTKLAYRRLGKDSGIPLVLQIHFRGNMDFWDPVFINALARSRPIIIFDNAGIGKSEGEIPKTFHGWALHIIALVKALKISKIDLLGFSMGGGAVQHAALAAPGLVRKLILAGTRTSYSSKTSIGRREIFYELADAHTEAEFKEAFAHSFFNPTPSGRAAAQASLERIFSRTQDRAPQVSVESAKRQTAAMAKFNTPDPENPYERIHSLTLPVFVANGDNDLLIPTSNSFDLSQLLPNAHLHIYPNSGHGFLYQHAELFVAHINLFLDSDEEELVEGGTVRARLS